MTTRALTTVANTAIEAYGEREQLNEVFDRMMQLHPAAKQVGSSGMRAAAQLAIMVGASPLPSTNEIHIWAQGGRVMMDLGINYFRRRRDELGGVLWMFQPRQMNDRERQEHGVPNGQLAAICRAVKADDMVKWRQCGFTANEIWDMSAATGIGICGTNEAKNGRPAIWTAFKRAEKDLYRQLFPVMFAQLAEARGATVDIMPAPPDGYTENDFNEEFFGTEAEFEEVDYDAVVEVDSDDPLEVAIRAASTPNEFYAALVDNVDRYETYHHVKAAVKLLGASVRGEADERVKVARKLRDYALCRDAGMTQDDALASLDAPTFDEEE